MSGLYLGIELGSTRIKSVLIDGNANIIAQGAYEWKSGLVDGLWSYPLEHAEKGLQTSYSRLLENYGKKIERLDGIGISGMMHGYLAFDKDGNLLAPFRTWQNTNAAQAAEELSALFEYNVPVRWSVSQYWQSVLEGQPHVKDVEFLTTLAGYVHYRLTGRKVIGVNDASGMFPVDGADFDGGMIEKFNALLKEKGIERNFKDVLPEVMLAGRNAGVLTESGAEWLDTTGTLKAGCVLCPPEGDMGTGMIATNSVRPKTANVSSGTAGNVTVVLEKPLKNYYRQIDVISTPDGYPAALVHANNCTAEISAWVNLFGEVAEVLGVKTDKDALFTKLFAHSLNSDEEAGKLVGYNYGSGEPMAGTKDGLPLIARTADAKLNLANFMQMQIYSAHAALSLGMDILADEGVSVSSATAHGGFYKTDFVGQNAVSALLGAPVTVMSNAGEGGAWGIALLALYAANPEKPLADFLDGKFADTQKTTVTAGENERAKFKNFIARYKNGLAVERLASEILK